MPEFLGTGIVLIALIIIVIFAIRGSRKAKCDGNCASCGGSCNTGKNKNIKNAIAAKKVVSIEGMHCEHCKNSVESAVNKLGGAACVVELEKNRALVFTSREVPDEDIKSSIEELGFVVTNIVKEF